MGGSSSKEDDPKEDKSSGKEQIVETSSGFHLFEIHIPTVNKGMGFIVVVILVAVLLLWAFKHLRKRMAARPQRQQTNAVLPFTNPTLNPAFFNPAFPPGGMTPDTAYGWNGWNMGLPPHPMFFAPSEAARRQSSRLADTGRFQEVNDDEEDARPSDTWRTRSSTRATRDLP